MTVELQLVRAGRRVQHDANRELAHVACRPFVQVPLIEVTRAQPDHRGTTGGLRRRPDQ
jgi:hypothetical protein